MEDAEIMESEEDMEDTEDTEDMEDTEDASEDEFDTLHAHAAALHDTYQSALDRLTWLHAQFATDDLEVLIRQTHEETQEAGNFLARLIEVLP
jgi:hypothetical protein